MFLRQKIGQQRGLIGCVLVVVIGLATSSWADPYPYSFTCITTNDLSGASAAAGEAYLSVVVTDPGSDQVLFTFGNTAPTDNFAISEIYFDDENGLLSLLAGEDSIIDDPANGVDFVLGASPGDLPSGGNATPPFAATTTLLTEADSPAPKKGVNPGESLGLLFALNAVSFDSVIAAFDSGVMGLDTLRIGLHVTGFGDEDKGDDYSESFVTTKVVPVPGAVLLGSMGLSVAGYFLRRKKSLT